MAQREPYDERGEDVLAPSEALRRRVLASIQPATRLDGFVLRVAELFDLTGARAKEILGAADAAPGGGWVAAPLPGVQFFHLTGGARREGMDCGLVRLDPGTPFPRHRHKGVEWNLVLSGSAEEDTGQLWLPGDLMLREADSVHAFRALADEPLLFAVVLEGGIEVE
jgi:quercetin dioxygenase-like cupin family protein